MHTYYAYENHILNLYAYSNYHDRTSTSISYNRTDNFKMNQYLIWKVSFNNNAKLIMHTKIEIVNKSIVSKNGHRNMPRNEEQAIYRATTDFNYVCHQQLIITEQT